MYKVFFNDSTILVGSEMKKSLNDNIDEMFDICEYSSANQLINKIENSRVPLSFCIAGDGGGQTWDQFRKCFTEIAAAGGLVRNREGKLLFIYRFGYWDLPKGKIERNETPEFAALREVEEECGISGLKLLRQLDSTYHIYRSPFLVADKNLVLKETKWFLMDYAGTQNPVPQTEEDIVEIKWFDREDIKQIRPKIYASLREFLDKSLPVI